MKTAENISFLEKLGTTIDGVRFWFSRAWRIGLLMSQGAYLLAERRRLFLKLGEEVYFRILKGELRNPELEPQVHQLDRLTKKIEIEELRIRGLRFGSRAARAAKSAPEESTHTNGEGLL